MSVDHVITTACDQLELPSQTTAAAHHFWLQFHEFVEPRSNGNRSSSAEPAKDEKGKEKQRQKEQEKQKQVGIARQLDRDLVMISCLHLACKSTECHRKLRDIVNVIFTCLSASNGESQESFYRIGDEYWKLRESVGVTEFFLLRIVNFQVFVETPFGWAMHICRMLFEGDHHNQMKEWHTAGKAVFQLTDILLRDSMSLPVFQAHSPRAIACAVVTLAMQSLDIPLPQPKEEWCRLWGDMSTNRCDRILKELVAAIQRRCSDELGDRNQNE